MVLLVRMRIGSGIVESMVARRMFLLVLLVAGLLSFSPALFAQKYCDGESFHGLSGAQLLTCARSIVPDDFVAWDLAGAIRKKFGVRKILSMYPKSTANAQGVFRFALYHDHGPKITALMRRAARNVKPGLTTADNQYFALEYLAKECDPWALAQLNRDANFKDSYPVSCMQWQYTLAQFGKCGYKAAEAHLAVSLDAACVNNIVAAEQSLRQLLPESDCYKLPTTPDVYVKEEDCYLKAAKSQRSRKTANSE